MKIGHILEGTTENISLLKDVVSLIVANLPEYFVLDTEYEIYGSKLQAKGNVNYTLTDLETKYPKFAEIIKYIGETHFVFPYYRENRRVKTYGEYSSVDNQVFVNLAAIANSDDEKLKKSTLLGDRNNIYGFIPVLVHEVRHIIQHRHYPDHFFSRGRQGEYTTREIEIDAMWHNILDTYDPAKFKNARAYTTVIMNDLKNTRTLTAKQEELYTKKTINYYTNPKLSEPKLNTKERLVSYITKQVPKNIISLLQTRLDKGSRGDVIDFDLRKVSGYNYKNFLFPIPRIYGMLNTTLSSGVTNNVFQKNMLFLVPSLVLTGGDKKIAKDIVKYMKVVHNYTPREAIDSLDTGISPDSFDLEHLRSHMRQIYLNL